MVMYDKLTKNNHKGIYYKTRRIMIVTAVILGLGCSIAIPTYISIQKNDSTLSTKAEESVENDNENQPLEY